MSDLIGLDSVYDQICRYFNGRERFWCPAKTGSVQFPDGRTSIPANFTKSLFDIGQRLGTIWRKTSRMERSPHTPWRASANTPESESSPARKTLNMLSALNAARYLTRTSSVTWKSKRRPRRRYLRKKIDGRGLMGGGECRFRLAIQLHGRVNSSRNNPGVVEA